VASRSNWQTSKVWLASLHCATPSVHMKVNEGGCHPLWHRPFRRQLETHGFDPNPTLMPRGTRIPCHFPFTVSALPCTPCHVVALFLASMFARRAAMSSQRTRLTSTWVQTPSVKMQCRAPDTWPRKRHSDHTTCQWLVSLPFLVFS